MDKEREDWCKKYNIKIANEGFIDVFCGLPKHVKVNLRSDGKPRTYTGFDGREKTFEELTTEELKDLSENTERIIENLKNFNKHRNKETKDLER